MEIIAPEEEQAAAESREARPEVGLTPSFGNDAHYIDSSHLSDEQAAVLERLRSANPSIQSLVLALRWAIDGSTKNGGRYGPLRREVRVPIDQAALITHLQERLNGGEEISEAEELIERAQQRVDRLDRARLEVEEGEEHNAMED